LSGSQFFVIHLSDILAGASTTISTQITAENYIPPTEVIPPVYSDFSNIFDVISALHLPEHRTYDHQIQLEEGTTPPYGLIYPLSLLKQNTLQGYLDEHLSKGWI
jgi:hypothetical protein